MPPLERFVLHRLQELDVQGLAAFDAYQFQDVARPLTEFCQNELYSLLFDIRRDALYGDQPDSLRRRAARTVLDHLHRCLTTWLAPVLVFTAEEVWGTRYPNADSVHLLDWPEIDAGWRDDALDGQFTLVRKLREEAYLKLEELRRAKTIGSFLEARIDITTTHDTRIVALAGLDLAELLLVSEVTLAHGGEELLTVAKADLPKCARCWRHLPDVVEETSLCGRCEAVVGDTVINA
jgi:isoleucyl-tRNA synthetase